MSFAVYRIRVNNALANLSPRDQLALKLLGLFFGGLFIVYGLVFPTLEFRESAKADYQHEAQLLQWMKTQQASVASLQKTPVSQSNLSAASPLTLVNASAKAQQLTIKRIQPESNGSLRVWLTNVDFNQSLRWLQELEQQGLSIQEMNADREAPGKVNLRLTLATSH